jgi:hypothetical protein
MIANISEEHTASIFRAEVSSMFLRNFGNVLQVQMTSQQGRPPSTFSPPWEPQITNLSTGLLTSDEYVSVMLFPKQDHEYPVAGKHKECHQHGCSHRYIYDHG